MQFALKNHRSKADAVNDKVFSITKKALYKTDF